VDALIFSNIITMSSISKFGDALPGRGSLKQRIYLFNTDSGYSHRLSVDLLPGLTGATGGCFFMMPGRKSKFLQKLLFIIFLEIW